MAKAIEGGVEFQDALLEQRGAMVKKPFYDLTTKHIHITFAIKT